MSSYKRLRKIFKPLYKLWFNPKIIGIQNIPKDGPVIIASNHISKLDPCNIVISTNRVVHFMAKDKYYDKKVTGIFFRKMGCIKVLSNEKNKEAVNLAINILNNNEVIGIFPEGTRNKTEHLLLQFKYGAVSMAKKTNAYIVPVAIKGKYKFRSKDLIIQFGKPFKIQENESLEEANQILFEKIKVMLMENK